MERQELPNQFAIMEIKPKDKYQEENKDLMKITPDESDLIEITPDESDLIEETPDESGLIGETHEHDESEIQFKPDFQVHVAVNENENIIEINPEINNHVESILEQQGPVEMQECMETEENYQQVEVKTEYEFIEGDKVNNGNIMEYNNKVSYSL